jgi:hypothetical protein
MQQNFDAFRWIGVSQKSTGKSGQAVVQHAHIPVLLVKYEPDSRKMIARTEKIDFIQERPAKYLF